MACASASARGSASAGPAGANPWPGALPSAGFASAGGSSAAGGSAAGSGASGGGAAALRSASAARRRGMSVPYSRCTSSRTRHSTATWGLRCRDSMKLISSSRPRSTGWVTASESSLPSRANGARPWRSATLAGNTRRERGSASVKAEAGAPGRPEARARKPTSLASPTSLSSSRAVSSDPPASACRSSARFMSPEDTAPSLTSSRASLSATLRL